MIFEEDPKDTPSSGGDNDGNDFPDMPTNDRGQLTVYPTNPSDYPDMNTNDWGQRSLTPDRGSEDSE